MRAAGDQYATDFRALGDKFNPYVNAGGTALERVMGGLGLGSPDAGAAFTSAYRATPGYEAAFDTGQRAVTSSAAGRGGIDNGATLKALTRYGSNFEDQKSGDYISKLMALVNGGQTATGQQVSTIGTGLTGKLGTETTAYGGDMTAANTIGLGDIAAANARAKGSQNLLDTGLKIGGIALGAAGGIPGGGSGYLGSMMANTGVPGGGYLGTGGQVYPGPGYYPR